jgi:hypothetical protein
MLSRFFDYLYFKYYHWQIKVGNKDVANVFAMLFIDFITTLFVISVIGVIAMHIIPNPKESVPDWLLSPPSALITMGVILFFFRSISFIKSDISKF